MIAACVQNRFSFYNANHQLALERIYARHMSSGITVDNGMQGSTVHSYDSNGYLTSVYDSDADETTDFMYTAQGQVLRKSRETTGTFESVASTKQQYFALAVGKQLASSGNLDAQRVDSGFEAISSYYPAVTPNSYSVQQGDTLESIAQQMWGDASLWYLIADANGLRGSEALTQGRALMIPNLVTNRVSVVGYTAQQAIGDTLPTVPQPPPAGTQGGGCGVAEMLVTAVSVAVTVMVTGNPANGIEVGKAILGSMLGNAAGQGVAQATGLQQGFEADQMLKAGATAGLSAAAANQIGGLSKKLFSNDFQQSAFTATGTAFAYEGVSAAFNQRAFDWRGATINAVTTTAMSPLTDANKTGSALLVQSTRNALLASSTSYVLNKRFNAGGVQSSKQVIATAFGSAIVSHFAAIARGSILGADNTPNNQHNQQPLQDVQNGQLGSVEHLQDKFWNNNAMRGVLFASSDVIMNDWELSPTEKAMQALIINNNSQMTPDMQARADAMMDFMVENWGKDIGVTDAFELPEDWQNPSFKGMSDEQAMILELVIHNQYFVGSKAKAELSPKFIERAQGILIQQGYLSELSDKGSSNIDGIFGRKTDQAIMNALGDYYDPVISAAATEQNIPAELLKGLIRQESRFDRFAVSPSGAKGIAQFTSIAIKETGLENPFDANASINAAASLFNKQYKYAGLNDLELSALDKGRLALASYNAGGSTIKTAISNSNKGDLSIEKILAKDNLTKTLQQTPYYQNLYKGNPNGFDAKALEIIRYVNKISGTGYKIGGYANEYK